MLTKEKHLQQIHDRTIEEAQWMLENSSTVRKTADHFKRPVTTVYVDLTMFLQREEYFLWVKVRDLLNYNKQLKTGFGERMKRQRCLQRV